MRSTHATQVQNRDYVCIIMCSTSGFSAAICFPYRALVESARCHLPVATAGKVNQQAPTARRAKQFQAVGTETIVQLLTYSNGNECNRKVLRCCVCRFFERHAGIISGCAAKEELCTILDLSQPSVEVAIERYHP